MNKKLKFYFLLVGVIYIYSIVSHFHSTSSSFMAGFNEGRNSVKKENKNHSSVNVYHINAEPSLGAYSYPQKMINSITGEIINFESIGFIVKAELHEKHFNWYDKIFKIMSLVFALIYLGVFIAIPIYMFNIIQSVQNNRIFDMKNLKRIKWLGKFVIILFLIETFIGQFDYRMALNTIKIEGYAIQPYVPEVSMLMLGGVILLLSEMFSIALNMKEEQDLTI